MHRRAVRQALASAVPAERRAPERTSPALGPCKAMDTVVVPIGRASSEPERPAPALGAHDALIGTGAEEVAR